MRRRSTVAKDLKLGMLLDFYGGLLTEKQAAALDFYYNQDLSLGEIADEMGISRQGAMAFVKQGERHLLSFEEKLGLAGRFGDINAKIDRMRSIICSMPQNEATKELMQLTDSVSVML